MHVEILSRNRTRLLGVGFAYFLLAAATIATTRVGGGVALLWVATALLIAELHFSDRSRWLSIVMACGIGSFAATALFGFGLWAALPLAIINMAEGLIAAALIRAWLTDEQPLESIDAFTVFIVAGGILAPALTALGGAWISTMAGGDYGVNWLRWYTGHALGTITFTPIAFLLLRGGLQRWLTEATKRDVGAMAVVLSVVVIVSLSVFVQSDIPLLFAPMLPIVIATFRFGRLGAVLAVGLLSIIGGALTLAGHGPIRLLSVGEDGQLQFFQFYLAVTILTALPVAVDLSHRKRLNQQLRDSEARFRLLAHKSSDIVLNLDTMGRIRFASPSIKTLGGYEPDRMAGRAALDLVHPDYVDLVTRTHRLALAQPLETHIVEYRGQTADGRDIWLESHTQGVLDDHGRPDGVVSTVRDISHRKRKEAELILEAERDSLTGIANRRGFLRSLDQCLAGLNAGAPACIALFDIDHFKRVNDRYGHATGDEVLRRFAEIASATVRGHGLVGRLGGEEFAALLPNATLDQALVICDRIRQRIEAMDVACLDGAAVRVTVSAGLSVLGSSMRFEDVLARADKALYEAKAAGRNCLKLAA